jgi:hypothetical protein
MGGILTLACKLLVLDRAEFVTVLVGISFYVFPIIVASPGACGVVGVRRTLRMDTLDNLR